MKSYKSIITAAVAVISMAACSKSELQITPEPQEDAKMVQVTLGADFAATKTSMASDGKVLWSAKDTIKVQVGENAYDFELTSGSGSQTGTFAGVVSEDDAAVIKGTAAGTVSAFYPTSGASVPATQTWAENTFADNTFPMTASFTGPTDTPVLSFSTNAAVVRVQAVAASATSAVLSYTVGETPYSVTMDNLPTTAAKDLYFVVVPGAKEFNLSLDGAAAVTYYTKNDIVTTAGARYNITPPAQAKVGDTEYATLAEAVAAAKAGETVKLLGSTTITSPLQISTGVTIDLNGQTLSTGTMDGVAVSDKRAIDVRAENVTIKNGTITGPSIKYGYGLINTYAGASLTTENLTMNTTGICVISRAATAPVTIKSGTYTSTSSTAKTWTDQGSGCAVDAQSGGVVTIEGGTFTGSYYAAAIFTSGGTLNIKGGTFNKGQYEASSKDGSTSFYCSLLNDASLSGSVVGNLNITDGTIHGDVRGRVSDAAGHPTNLSISGGTFDGDCQLYNYDDSRITLSGYLKTAAGTAPSYGGAIWNLISMGDIPVTSISQLNTLLKNCTEEGSYVYNIPAETFSDSTITIKQRTGVNVTLCGSESGVTTLSQVNIVIDGMGGYGHSETVTIKNITFDYSNYTTTTEADIIYTTAATASSYKAQPHNITIDGCTFNGNSSNQNNIIAIKVPTGLDCCTNLTIKNCTAENVHSLAQLESTYGVTITECTLNCGRGVNLQGSKNIVISDNTWTISDYIIRAGQSKYAGTNNTTMKIYGNTFTKTSKEDDGCLVLRYDCPTDITFCDNTITYSYDSGNKYDVVNKKNLDADTEVKTDNTDITYNDLSKLAITKGTWDKSTKTFTPSN